MANPYSVEFIKGLIGQQETQRFELKSSRDLLNESSQRRGKFLSDQIVPTVSAFLNTDGGQLVIGVEEKDSVAVGLSDGIPRNRLSSAQLQSAICDRIQPAVAGYVSVFPVEVGVNTNGEKLLAFVVDVRPGTTAYQADDKKYYVRRSGQSEAMEDKDIRLRMLAGDKPKLTINLNARIVPNLRFVQVVAWDLSFDNVGIRNIPRAIIRSKLNIQGLSDQGRRVVTVQTPEYRETSFPFKDLDANGLLPGRRFELEHFRVVSSAFMQCGEPEAVTMFADVVVYVDDGLPAELANYDLMTDLRPVIKNDWMMSAN